MVHRAPVGKPDRAPLVREILILPSADTREIVGIVAGPERSSYTPGLFERPLHVVTICDTTHAPNYMILSVVGSPLKGSLVYSIGTCFGDGPHIKRVESNQRISRKDREIVKAFCESLRVEKGGVR